MYYQDLGEFGGGTGDESNNYDAKDTNKTGEVPAAILKMPVCS